MITPPQTPALTAPTTSNSKKRSKKRKLASKLNREKLHDEERMFWACVRASQVDGEKYPTMHVNLLERTTQFLAEHFVMVNCPEFAIHCPELATNNPMFGTHTPEAATSDLGLDEVKVEITAEEMETYMELVETLYDINDLNAEASLIQLHFHLSSANRNQQLAEIDNAEQSGAVALDFDSCFPESTEGILESFGIEVDNKSVELFENLPEEVQEHLELVCAVKKYKAAIAGNGTTGDTGPPQT